MDVVVQFCCLQIVWSLTLCTQFLIIDMYRAFFSHTHHAFLGFVWGCLLEGGMSILGADRKRRCSGWS
jgi:hypothetical protein